MSVKTLTEQILEKISKVKRWQFRFMVHLFPLWLAIRGRYNFTNLARWGELGEDTYRHNFGRPFDWLAFNVVLARETLSAHIALAFDPCFIPKSGKHTPGIGYFYSGCAGREQRGLEFSGIAAIDLAQKTALHLEAVQTIKQPQDESLLDFYARILRQRKQELQQLSRYVAADAFFARQPFVQALQAEGFHLVTRLRKDVRLRYLYHGPQTKGKGRPKTYQGRVDLKALRPDHFVPCAQAEDGSWTAYHAVLNVQAWKCNARVVIVHHFDADGQIKSVKVYACTDPAMDGTDVLHTYQCRFQIEFLFRDAKQYTGLAHCQARDEDKLGFHLNTALTAVSLAKAAYHLTIPGQERGPFSMADIKTQYANDLLFSRFIATFGSGPNMSKINSIREQLRKIGTIAA